MSFSGIKAQSDEIDRILDKLKKSGYDSLTTEEKKSLFDALLRNVLSFWVCVSMSFSGIER